MPFRPGQSGNPRGRPRKGKSLSELLQARGEQERAGGKSWQQTVVEKLWAMAADGNLRAIRLILEYLVGKPREMATEEEAKAKVVYTGDDFAHLQRDLEKWRAENGYDTDGGGYSAWAN